MRAKLISIAMASCALCQAALGQGVANSKAAPAAQPPDGKWTFSGSLRLRPEVWSWFGSGSGDGSYSYLGSILRVAGRQVTQKDEFLLEAAAPVILGLPDKAVHAAPQGQLGLGASYQAASGTDAASLFLKQAYWRRKGLLGPGRDLRLGRFEFVDGTETTPADPSLAWLKKERIAHRLIGNFGWSHVGRSFDGVQVTLNQGAANYTGFFGIPTRGVFDVHGMDDISDVRVGYLSANWARKEGAVSSDTRLFAVFYDDDRNVTKVDNRPSGIRSGDKEIISMQTVGGHYVMVVPAGHGKADILAWGAGQFGSWGALTQRAYAFAFEAGFQPSTSASSPWIRAGFSHFSGDGNPADSNHETFIPLLPTPRIYARFPFFTTANLDDAFLELILRPNKKMSIRTDIHRLWLADKNDLWYSGGGAFQDQPSFGYAGRPSGGSTNLATLLDASIDYALNKSTSVTLYGAYAQGGGAVRASFPGRDAAFGYLELNHRW